MKEEDALRIVKAYLDAEGAEWREESGWIRFRYGSGIKIPAWQEAMDCNRQQISGGQDR